MARKESGELELQVLQILWEEQEASVGEIVRHLPDKRAYTTVMTVLQRMYRKGTLEREKRGREYIYRPNGSSRGSFIQRLRKQLFGDKSAKFITYLLGSEDLTEKDLDQLQKTIEETRRSLK